MGKGIVGANRRETLKFNNLMPRTGTAIADLQHTFQKKEFDGWVDQHRNLLSTLLFVCRSGMLLTVEQDLRREHWLSESSRYFPQRVESMLGLHIDGLVQRYHDGPFARDDSGGPRRHLEDDLLRQPHQQTF